MPVAELPVVKHFETRPHRVVTDRVSVNNRVGGLYIVPEIRVKTVLVDARAVRRAVEAPEASACKREFLQVYRHDRKRRNRGIIIASK